MMSTSEKGRGVMESRCSKGGGLLHTNQIQMQKRGGSKNPKILQTSLMEALKGNDETEEE